MGVARQYCGQLGKQDNCQVAVSLSLANRHTSLPVAWRLYLAEDWAGDAARRRKGHVPKGIGFKAKPEMALEQIRAASEAGLPRGVVLRRNRLIHRSFRFGRTGRSRGFGGPSAADNPNGRKRGACGSGS